EIPYYPNQEHIDGGNGLQGAMGYPASAAPTPAPVNYPVLQAMPISASSLPPSPPYSLGSALPVTTPRPYPISFSSIY
ncbi:Uncharacterized protein APZ42_001775, partial [Daphnia magna]